LQNYSILRKWLKTTFFYGGEGESEIKREVKERGKAEGKEKRKKEKQDFFSHHLLSFTLV